MTPTLNTIQEWQSQMNSWGDSFQPSTALQEYLGPEIKAASETFATFLAEAQQARHEALKKAKNTTTNQSLSTLSRADRVAAFDNNRSGASAAARSALNQQSAHLMELHDKCILEAQSQQIGSNFTELSMLVEQAKQIAHDENDAWKNASLSILDWMRLSDEVQKSLGGDQGTAEACDDFYSSIAKVQANRHVMKEATEHFGSLTRTNEPPFSPEFKIKIGTSTMTGEDLLKNTIHAFNTSKTACSKLQAILQNYPSHTNSDATLPPKLQELVSGARIIREGAGEAWDEDLHVVLPGDS